MVDNPNKDYYRPSKGSISGFDQLNLPDGSSPIVETGFSLDQLKAFLLNQNEANFPSYERLLQTEAEIRNHENDFNNPHKTTLDQIVGDFTPQVLGNIIPGTTADVSPFYSFEASLALPIGNIIPATYSNNNLYRQTSGGWFVDTSIEPDTIGTDYISNRPGLPLFSQMNNIVPTDWATETGTKFNTTISQSTDQTLNYPFPFYDVKENPGVFQFGMDIPMVQDLQVYYTAAFFVKPGDVGGSLRIYQPSDSSNYITLDLTDGSLTITATDMVASSIRYSNGVIRVCIGFKSLLPSADNKLRLVHLNDGDTSNGTRTGSVGRYLFSIARPQVTKSALNQPVMKDLTQTASTSTFVPNLSKIGTPQTLPKMIVTMTLDLYPMLPLAPVLDATIMTFGALTITRDQTKITVSLNGTVLFTSVILEGLNIITLSYSNDKIIFKDLANPRQVVTGTYSPLSTANVSFGPFGGYLHNVAFYAQSDNTEITEFLNNA